MQLLKTKTKCNIYAKDQKKYTSFMYSTAEDQKIKEKHYSCIYSIWKNQNKKIHNLCIHLSKTNKQTKIHRSFGVMF